jgi:hypothetical protein
MKLKKKSSPWKLLSQYLLSLVAILDGSRDQRTQFWKGAIQESFQQSLVDIGSVVSEEEIFFLISSPLFKPGRDGPWVGPFQNCVRQARPPFKMDAVTKNRNFFKWPKLLYFKPESAKI